MGRVVDKRAELAVLIGVARQTVKFWAGKGMPVREDGKYDYDEIKKWHAKNFKKRRGAPTAIQTTCH